MFEYSQKCSLCLLKETEVAPFLEELKQKAPNVKMDLFPSPGMVQILFQGKTPLDAIIEQVKEKFPTFYCGEGSVEEALHQAFIEKKQTLALAESCTGGAIASKLTKMPGASLYFLGSIVAYSNGWKERFLQVSRSSLKQKGAVSREVVIEMVQGLFNETDADFAAAVSGVAGPTGGTKNAPVGTIYIAVGRRGDKIDAGVIHGPKERLSSIDLSLHLTLGAVWRRLVHKTATFS